MTLWFRAHRHILFLILTKNQNSECGYAVAHAPANVVRWQILEREYSPVVSQIFSKSLLDTVVVPGIPPLSDVRTRRPQHMKRDSVH